MRKAGQARPNERLKHERELRGWSQKYVAEHLGADLYAISRWERGMTVPSPYYRQRLCELFGKDARQLGLVPEPGKEDHESAQRSSPGASTSHDKHSRVDDPEIPLPMAGILGRASQIELLKTYLRAGQADHLAAISGLPGVGKTTLALALAYDEQIRAHFRDGILWVGLGQHPDIQGSLSRWANLLGVSSQEAARLRSVDDWMKAIRLATARRRLLFIIDDAWKIEDALAFKAGGPECAYLLTTRFPGLAQTFAFECAMKLHELPEDDGFALLARLAGEAVVQEESELRALVRAVGGLPLALTIMGKYLRLQAHTQQPRRIRAVLQRLHSTQERLRLSSPVSPLERPASLGNDTALSLQTIIALSDYQLEEQEQRLLRALAVFPAKPNSFSEEAALAVGALPVELLDSLGDAGLLESSSPGRYTLHQTIVDYARLHAEEREVATRLAEYFAHDTEAHQHDDAYLEREMNNILAALEAAYNYTVSLALISCANACVRFWEQRGQYEQAEHHLQRARQACLALQNEAGLLTTLTHLGRILLARGAFEQAQAHLQEGAALARKHGNTEQECEIMYSLGVAKRNLGDYELAEHYLKASLALARQLGREEMVGKLLNTLGALAGEQGRYPDAEEYLRKGLEIARAIHSLAGMRSALHGLGTLVSMRGEYQQSEAYYQEAADYARRNNDQRTLGLLLTNLGSVAGEQGHYAQAEKYLQESLALARHFGHPENLCMLFANLGEVACKQGKYAEAEAHYHEGLSLARQIQHAWHTSIFLTAWGNYYLQRAEESEGSEKGEWLKQAQSSFEAALQEVPTNNRKKEADILFGLARVAHMQSNHSAALRYAHDSLAIFDEVQDISSAQVRQFLNQINHASQ